MTSGEVSLSPPFLALVMGVLIAAQITTSSGCLLLIFSREICDDKLANLCIKVKNKDII